MNSDSQDTTCAIGVKILYFAGFESISLIILSLDLIALSMNAGASHLQISFAIFVEETDCVSLEGIYF